MDGKWQGRGMLDVDVEEQSDEDVPVEDLEPSVDDVSLGERLP